MTIRNAYDVPYEYLLFSWNAWNLIHNHVEERVFNLETKSAAIMLERLGSQSRFIKTLAGGNLLIPEDVIETALEFERMDRMV